jgi:hypothetical protein
MPARSLQQSGSATSVSRRVCGVISRRLPYHPHGIPNAISSRNALWVSTSPCAAYGTRMAASRVSGSRTCLHKPQDQQGRMVAEARARRVAGMLILTAGLLKSAAGPCLTSVNPTRERNDPDRSELRPAPPGRCCRRPPVSPHSKRLTRRFWRTGRRAMRPAGRASRAGDASARFSGLGVQGSEKTGWRFAERRYNAEA